MQKKTKGARDKNHEPDLLALAQELLLQTVSAMRPHELAVVAAVLRNQFADVIAVAKSTRRYFARKQTNVDRDLKEVNRKLDSANWDSISLETTEEVTELHRKLTFTSQRIRVAGRKCAATLQRAYAVKK